MGDPPNGAHQLGLRGGRRVDARPQRSLGAGWDARFPGVYGLVAGILGSAPQVC